MAMTDSFKLLSAQQARRSGGTLAAMISDDSRRFDGWLAKKL